MAAPMPRDPPVTMATLPSFKPMTFLQFLCRHRGDRRNLRSGEKTCAAPSYLERFGVPTPQSTTCTRTALSGYGR
jgi:hypothetical protein